MDIPNVQFAILDAKHVYHQVQNVHLVRVVIKDIYQLIVARVILNSGITIQLHVYHVNTLAKVVQLIQDALNAIVHFKDFGSKKHIL